MDIRSRFVTDILSEEGGTHLEYQEGAIRRFTERRTGRLIGDRTARVTGGGGSSGTLTITHPDYERFLDMKRLGRRRKANRRRRIHNRFVFGTYGHIAGRLMTGLTDEVVGTLREQGF